MKRVAVHLHPGALEQLDDLARLKGCSRADVLRDCITWGLAREYAWLRRALAVERHREQRRADEEEAIQRAWSRHPERFDSPAEPDTS